MINKLKKTRKLYHGTFEENVQNIKDEIRIDLNEKIINGKKKKSVDNGSGFYTALTREQARDFAVGRAKIFGKVPAVIKYEVNTEYLFSSDQHYRYFEDSCLDWAEFVFNNRADESLRYSSDHNCDGKHPVVINKMMDSGIPKFFGKVRKDAEKGKEIDYNKLFNEISENPIENYSQVSFHCKDMIDKSLIYVSYETAKKEGDEYVWYQYT